MVHADLTLKFQHVTGTGTDPSNQKSLWKISTSSAPFSISMAKSCERLAPHLAHLRLKLKLEKQHTRMMLRLLCIAAVAPALAFVSRPAARPLSRPVAARVCRQETVRCAAIPLGKQSDEDYVSSIPIDSPPVDATKELPKVNGAIIAGTRTLCVITGASSGLGKEAADIGLRVADVLGEALGA